MSSIPAEETATTAPSGPAQAGAAAVPNSTAGSTRAATDIAAIGTQADVVGFGLAGARVYPAETVEEVRAAWRALPKTVAVVILTPEAAQAIDEQTRTPHGPLTVTTPA